MSYELIAGIADIAGIEAIEAIISIAAIMAIPAISAITKNLQPKTYNQKPQKTARDLSPCGG